MEIIEYLYKEIKDPLDDNSVISYLIKESNSHDLVHKSKKEKPKRGLEQNYFSELIIYLYTLWKNNILNASNEELEKYTSSYGIDFFKVKEELEKIPEITDYSEYKKVFWNKDSQLFNCSGFIERNAKMWLYCDSVNTTLGKNMIKANDITHRLYVSTDVVKAVLFVKSFIEKCVEYNIPYHLKTPRTYQVKDDNVVIYTNNKWLEQHLLITNDIIKNSKDIIFFEPPALTGKINDFIGYGSEPVTSGLSFNTKRKYFLEITKTEVEIYFEKNKYKEYLFNGNLMTLQEINEKTISEFSRYKISDKALEVISEDEELIKIVRKKIKSSLFDNGICQKSCFDIACLDYKYSDGEYKKDVKKDSQKK